MDFLTFIFMVLSIAFICMNKFTGAIFIMSLFSILFLLFYVVFFKY